jgi:hypothetical protein
MYIYGLTTLNGRNLGLPSFLLNERKQFIFVQIHIRTRFHTTIDYSLTIQILHDEIK